MLTPIGDAAQAPEQLPPVKMPKLFSGANPNPDPAAPTWTFLCLTNYQMAHIRELGAWRLRCRLARLSAGSHAI